MLGTVLGRCGGSSGRTRTQNGNNTLTIKAAKLAAIYSGCKTGRVCVLFGSNRCFDALAVCLRRLLLLSPIAMVTSRLFYNVFCHRRCCFRGTTTPRLEKIEKKTIKKSVFHSWVRNGSRRGERTRRKVRMEGRNGSRRGRKEARFLLSGPRFIFGCAAVIE